MSRTIIPPSFGNRTFQPKCRPSWSIQTARGILNPKYAPPTEVPNSRNPVPLFRHYSTAYHARIPGWRLCYALTRDRDLLALNIPITAITTSMADDGSGTDAVPSPEPEPEPAPVYFNWI